jgi:hypothetical protein
VNLEQSGSIGGSFVVVIILRNFSRLLIREFRAAPTDTTFLTAGIQCDLGPLSGGKENDEILINKRRSEFAKLS